jgi:hypothetical protein
MWNTALQLRLNRRTRAFFLLYMGFGLEFHRLRLGRDVRCEKTVFADSIRDRREIFPLLFQHAVLLFQGRCAGFHAALLAANADPDHIAGGIFVGVCDGQRDRIIAVGAREGRVV